MRAFIIALMMLIATPLTAHPPKSVDLDYDGETGLLSVEIGHSVNAASKHYVNKVVVELNGKKHVEQYFNKQIDGEMQQAIYKIIDAAEGDMITVTAYCNISGRRKGELEVTLKKDEELTE
jgi:desulfoferrodoxin (superoxide reductase-like protein)